MVRGRRPSGIPRVRMFKTVVRTLREPKREEVRRIRRLMIHRVCPGPEPGAAWGTAESGA